MKIWKRIGIKNVCMLTLAGIISAVAVTMFLQPVRLYDSGISGTAQLLGQLTPESLSLSFFLLVLNVPLLLYGLKKQGARFTAYAIYGVAVYSVSAWVIENLLPMDLTSASPLAGTDLLLCALFGGLIAGIGSGTAIRFGGAIDGIEVMAVIFARRLGISVGTFVMIYNILLYIVCGVVLQSWTLPLYSIVTYAAALKAVDFIVDGLDKAKCAIIITTRPAEICQMLGDTFETGSTRIAARGGFSNQEKTMIYFIVNRFQVVRLREQVHEMDPQAYITISDVADVFHAEKDA